MGNIDFFVTQLIFMIFTHWVPWSTHNRIKVLNDINIKKRYFNTSILYSCMILYYLNIFVCCFNIEHNIKYLNKIKKKLPLMINIGTYK